ncbi:hypothetical protein MRB53_038345 [Persea americana]|nr:hypothetical protein MRB53_038345 [Persea americana]
MRTDEREAGSRGVGGATVMMRGSRTLSRIHPSSSTYLSYTSAVTFAYISSRSTPWQTSSVMQLSTTRLVATIYSCRKLALQRG